MRVISESYRDVTSAKPRKLKQGNEIRIGSDSYRVEQGRPDRVFMSLVDQNGRDVSRGYHSIEVVKGEGRKDLKQIVVGRSGALRRVLTVDEERGVVIGSAKEYHDVKIRRDLGDLLVGKTGARNWILGEDGEPISRGYHRFTIERGFIYGQTGAHEEVVFFNEDMRRRVIRKRLK